jgi:hypothetical protein
VLVIQQADNFAISGSCTPEECNKLQQTMQKHKANKLHNLGIIKRFNGLDVCQTRDHLKFSCKLHVDKIVSHHGWENEKAVDRLIPAMRNDSAHQASLELATAPETETGQQKVEKAMELSCRQASGKLACICSCCLPTRLDHPCNQIITTCILSSCGTLQSSQSSVCMPECQPHKKTV